MFSLGTSDSPVTHADPIDWKSEKPVWVDQWPLTQEKLSAAQQLVQEQLRLGHIEPSTSAWNSPIFVIKKKSGKWRLLQDLRKDAEAPRWKPERLVRAAEELPDTSDASHDTERAHE